MKDRKTYKALTLLGLLWIIPVNRMYTGERWGWRLLTINWFYIGVITDLFYINKRFDETMAGRGFMNTERRRDE